MNINTPVFGDDASLRSPIFKVDDKKRTRSPIFKVGEDSNTHNKFVISKTTQGGKFLIGDTLIYRFRNFDIITEKNNMIFIDIPNGTIFIRSADKVLQSIAPEDPEEKQYILLLYDSRDDTDEPTWQSISGRTTTYEWIKMNVESFNPAESFVLTENVAFKDALTISQFVKYLHNADIVNDEFDIEDYEIE